MAQLIKPIEIDCSRPNRSQTTVSKQGDINSRFLYVSLADNGNPIEITSENTVIVNYKRGDGEINSFSGTVNEDGTVMIPLTSWLLDVSGSADCEIVIYDSTEQSRLSTTLFTLYVEPFITDDSEVTEDSKYDILLTLISQVDTAVNACNTAAESAKQATSDAENIRNQIISDKESGLFKGDKGDKGDTGEKGETGTNGTDGKSAYEIAVEQGYSGTVEEWLESLKASNFKKLDLTEAINLSSLNDGAYQVTVGGYVTAPKNTEFRVEKDGLIFIESRDYGYFNCFIADRKPKLISWIDGDFKEFELQELPSYIQGIDSVIEFIIATLPNEYAKKTEIPTKTSELENDSDYTTQSYVNDVVNSTKTRIVTDADNFVISTFELADNTEYRFTLELESIEFTLPENPTDDYISSLVFKSGTTATTITYSNTIKWTGEDISSDKFVPASGKTYEVLIYWNGFNYCGIVKRW